jgi:hypothetical protein
MRLLALDPGETTGYAVFVDGKPIAFGEMDRWHGLKTLIRAERPDAVVVESFRLYASKAAVQIGSEFIPAQVVGVARFLAGEADVPLTFQPASVIHDGESKLSPPMARLVNPVSPPGNSPHGRDALAHGFYFLRSQEKATLPPAVAPATPKRPRRARQPKAAAA